MRGIPIRQIACGGCHTVILQDNNDVLVFGCNDDGQLGLGNMGLGPNHIQNKPVILMQVACRVADKAIRQIACSQ